MANTFNGIGSTYYGQSQFEPDGSFVTTKWFVIGFAPLIPLASARLQYLGSSGIPFLSRSSSYELIEELPIAWLQVLKTWLYTIFIITLVTGMLASNKAPALKIVVIMAGIVLPHLLRFFAKRQVGA